MPPKSTYTQQVGVHQQQGDLGRETDMNPGGILAGRAKLSGPGHLTVARIKKVDAGLYTYVVDSAEFKSRLATDVAPTSGAVGARHFHVYAVGTYVLVWFQHIDDSLGYIIGSVPQMDQAWAPLRGTVLSAGSPSGYGRDWVHCSHFNLRSKGAACGTYNQGKPWDAINGDTGVINELGVGWAVLKLLVKLRAGSTEIAVSRLDDAIRMYAKRLSVETEATEEHTFNDQGECSTVRYRAPHSWEGLGAFTAKGDVANYSDSFKLTTDDPNPAKAAAPWSPKDWNQIGIFRFMELSGYLGDMIATWIGLPIQKSGPVTRTSTRNWPGLFSSRVGSDGFMAIRTAKGILLEKTNIIPVPEQHREPWDPKGDSGDACDWDKDTRDVSEYDYQYNTTEPMARQAASLDHNAFRKDIADVRNVLDHEKDWKIAKEADVTPLVEDDAAWRGLQKSFRAPLPPAADCKVDARRDKLKIFKSTSFLHMLDDGGIVIQDGYGSVINMSGGNIEISAVGDIIMRPGRRIVGIAPHDVIMRAGNNAELTTAIGDVRIKSQRNMHLLSGNAGNGGFLCENRAKKEYHEYDGKQGSDVKSSGITFKSTASSIIGWASNIYLRTLGYSLGHGAKVTGTTAGTVGIGGRIVLDASGGGGFLDFTGDKITAMARTSIRNVVGVEAAKSAVPAKDLFLSEQTSSQFAVISENIKFQIAGGVVNVLGGKRSEASMFLDGGVTAGGSMACAGGTVGEFKIKDMKTQVDGMKRSLESMMADFRESQFASFYAAAYTDALKSWGNSRYIATTQFSFNTSTQYGTDTDFTLYEFPWQARHRVNGFNKVLYEADVYAAGQPTMPWPGRETWTGKTYGRIQDSKLNNFDLQQFIGKDAREDGQDKQGVPPELGAFEERYIVDWQGR